MTCFLIIYDTNENLDTIASTIVCRHAFETARVQLEMQLLMKSPCCKFPLYSP